MFPRNRFAPSALRRLSNDGLLLLLRTEGDTLPRSVPDEFLRRSQEIVPALIGMLDDDALWEEEGDDCAILHALSILGYIGGPEVKDALLRALLKADSMDLDWHLESFHTILPAQGPAIAEDLLALFLDSRQSWYVRSTAGGALAALSAQVDDPHRKRYRDAIASIVKDDDADWNLRSCLACDLLETGEEVYRPLIEAYLDEADNRHESDDEPLYFGRDYAERLWSGVEKPNTTGSHWMELYDRASIGQRLKQRRAEEKASLAAEERGVLDGPKKRALRTWMVLVGDGLASMLAPVCDTSRFLERVRTESIVIDRTTYMVPVETARALNADFTRPDPEEINDQVGGHGPRRCRKEVDFPTLSRIRALTSFMGLTRIDRRHRLRLTLRGRLFLRMRPSRKYALLLWNYLRVMSWQGDSQDASKAVLGLVQDTVDIQLRSMMDLEDEDGWVCISPFFNMIDEGMFSTDVHDEQWKSVMEMDWVRALWLWKPLEWFDLLDSACAAEDALPTRFITHVQPTYCGERVLPTMFPTEEMPDVVENIFTITLKGTQQKTMTGRNEPCSCGSGKKFKKCCGA